ncbi:Stretch-activated cation channel MID1 [Wickerhamomyces ciferrii]|uniref:Stretch-activated cation channel MID1 n=1 Tax=Wickerhamomyces ciferrii (strain ATCC 14091 / BCRC 22168 / CBS 111 / JCM 3599 / NBRC 0793 / NRRL Y-1031 F-60-10) TaxID=1206466 RepID=K0KUL7_WICCF|nr:Stretch-activated cation channel MID1 [Wickerhamomyces ciferrii]CCH44873.1 Stretch-activated cation channel MID1 [Wickerhamomyces ciferrii]
MLRLNCMVFVLFMVLCIGVHAIQDKFEGNIIQNSLDEFISIDCSEIKDPEERAECLGKVDDLLDSKFDDWSLLDKRDISQLTGSSDPHQVYDWRPVSINIEPGQALQYRFEINTTHPYNQVFYQVLVYITGNLCNHPIGLSNPNDYLTLFYGLNDTGIFENTTSEDLHESHKSEGFENGYLQATSYTTVKTNGTYYLDMLLVADDVPDFNGSFTVQLGVSQDDLLFQWDNRTWINLVDSDDTTALFITGNLTTKYNNATDILSASSNYYTIHVFHDEQSNYFSNMYRSWCSIVNSVPLVPPENITYSFTQRGGGIKEQIYVRGLQPSTDYIAYVTQDFSNKDDGGVVFDRISFRTKDPDICQLVFNLTFCDNVAYSVPRSSNLEIGSDFANLGRLYDEYAEEAFGNFSKALDQIPCDAENDQRYSPIVTCDDCRTSYKNWLCGVTIPRCTTENQTHYKHRPLGESRMDFINDSIDPPSEYFEVLPCINMCYAMVRDCPADFSFSCPRDNASLVKSYYYKDDDYSYDTCNYVGIIPKTSGAIHDVVMNKGILFVSLMFIGFVLG